MTAAASSSSSQGKATPSPSLRNIQPPQHRGMKELDRDAFTLRVPVLALRIPAAQVGVMRKHPAMNG